MRASAEWRDMNNRLPLVKPFLGADPEFFFTRNDRIIASDEVLKILTYDRLVRDGIQVEFHPFAHPCREVIGIQFARVFDYLRGHLPADVKLLTHPSVVEIDEETFKALPADVRRLGCMPSENIYGPQPPIPDGQTYRTRSAGGHIHLGLNHLRYGWASRMLTVTPSHVTTEDIFDCRTRIVAVMDVLLGNTSVLLDRESGQKKRREVYGRAGEYRLPKHGLEYRTLSNFWCRSYPLTSLFLGLARTSVSVVMGSILTDYGKQAFVLPSKKIDPEKDLFDAVNMRDIQEAINNNDFDLAARNFQAVKGWMREWLGRDAKPIDDNRLPIEPDYLVDFDYFVAKGIDHWFGEDPIAHWSRFMEVDEDGDPKISTHGSGWECFLHDVVRKERRSIIKAREK